MYIQDIVQQLDQLAPPQFQESYDNCGLLIGDSHSECSGVMVCLDLTEAVLQEALLHQCNLIVAHHPLIFKDVKKINPNTPTGQLIYLCIQHHISVYALHTNLDNVLSGVNQPLAQRLGLKNISVLYPLKNTLCKLYTYVPIDYAEHVRQHLFLNGAGDIGNYSECSFNIKGQGTYKPNEKAQPFKGEALKRHTEDEVKIEVVLPQYAQSQVIQALIKHHPYEEVAYDIVPLHNTQSTIGAGCIGELDHAMDGAAFLSFLKTQTDTKAIQHSQLLPQKIKKVALCGGAGSFLLPHALQRGADAFITSDCKYHDYFTYRHRIVLCSIGHYESEHYCIPVIYNYLIKKNPNFAIRQTSINTNFVSYFL